jgi:hypothetical protein
VSGAGPSRGERAAVAAFLGLYLLAAGAALVGD